MSFKAKRMKKTKRKIYIKEIPVGYSCNARKGVKRGVSKELIISNLKLPPFK